MKMRFIQKFESVSSKEAKALAARVTFWFLMKYREAVE
jgi:hypothetical protein